MKIAKSMSVKDQYSNISSNAAKKPGLTYWKDDFGELHIIENPKADYDMVNE